MGLGEVRREYEIVGMTWRLRWNLTYGPTAVFKSDIVFSRDEVTVYLRGIAFLLNTVVMSDILRDRA